MELFIKSLAAVQSTPNKNEPITKLSLANNRRSSNQKNPLTRAVAINNTNKMPNRNRVINKLALVLISIVVLELVLIGDQVQPVKAIKKKIYLKKLKKLLPLFALVKPKKKIILLPIPIPMFKSHSSYPNTQHSQHHARPTLHQIVPPTVTSYSSSMQTPVHSFMMMDNSNSNNNNNDKPAFMSLPMESQMPISMSGDVEPILTEPTISTSMSGSTNQNSSSGAEQSISVLGSGGGPSMTMTIQSKPDGGSNIELSTNMNGGGESGALLQRPSASSGAKWRGQSPAKQLQLHKQQQQQQQQLLNLNDHFDEPSDQAGGEQYYSSPWANRSPLVSPAKLQQLQHQQQRQKQHSLRQQSWPLMAHEPHFGASLMQHNSPTLNQLQMRPLQAPIISQHQTNPWRALGPLRLQQQHQQQIDQQQLTQALEFEELMPVGPLQEMPTYRAPNGQLHIPLAPLIQSRPAAIIEQEQELLRGNSPALEADLGEEVQTLGPNKPADGGPNQSTQRPKQQHQQTAPLQRPHSVGKTSGGGQPPLGRLISPASKGKQRQQSNQQQQQQQQVGATKQKIVVAGGY